MSESYRAILADGELRWLDDVPDILRHGTENVRIRVTIEEQDGENDEDELASLLDELAEADPFSAIEDPVAWQRTLRND